MESTTTTRKKLKTTKSPLTATVNFRVKKVTHQLVKGIKETMKQKTGMKTLDDADILNGIFNAGIEPFLEQNELTELLEAYRIEQLVSE